MASRSSGAINHHAKLAWENVAEVFDQLDSDGNGRISMDELRDKIVAQGYSKDVATLLMAELDANGDGELSFEELHAGLAKSQFMSARKKAAAGIDWSRLLPAVVYFLVGVVVYGWLEGWRPLDTVYFLMVTCTTVGYGDVTPATRWGKLFTCGYALVGMTLVVQALSPVVDFLSSSIDAVEQSISRWLERQGLIPPKVDTLDMSLTVAQVNATINYTRRYLIALCQPIVVLVAGVAIAQLPGVVASRDWVDQLYWALISMTTIGYGDFAPSDTLTKTLVLLYLPVSVAVLAQSLTDVAAIGLRKSIRETDYGEKLAGEFLLDECIGNATADENITEAEFLVRVLLRRNVVDEQTITAVRRQFRELVRDGPKDVPVESRSFNTQLLYSERLKRGQVKQRPAGMPVGSRGKGGAIALVDFGADDGGLAEWHKHHWMPAVEAGLPPMVLATQKARKRGGNMGGNTFAPWLVAMKRWAAARSDEMI